MQGSIKGVAAVYQRHDFLAERKAALAGWAAYVLRVARLTPAVAQAGNVVALRKRTRKK